jgi:hypothetical protein
MYQATSYRLREFKAALHSFQVTLSLTKSAVTPLMAAE